MLRVRATANAILAMTVARQATQMEVFLLDSPIEALALEMAAEPDATTDVADAMMEEWDWATAAACLVDAQQVAGEADAVWAGDFVVPVRAWQVRFLIPLNHLILALVVKHRLTLTRTIRPADLETSCKTPADRDR